MCGIVGIVTANRDDPWLGLVEAANATQASRGPDAMATDTRGNVALGHTRLAIIDTSATANQPMADESGRYQIIYNGEVYNFAELRRTLIADGISFRSESDTEVVLQLLIRHGNEALLMLNGFFALAFVDHRDGSVFIARDRIGIKPLYLYSSDGRVAFASEMKALLTLPIDRELDQVSLFQYLQLNYVPHPHTMLRSVQKISPGHCATIRDGQVDIESYYKIPMRESARDSIDYATATRKVRELAESSITRRMVSDVPLGTFLSGGLDSTIISAIAAKKADQLQTFSIGFPDSPIHDETGYAESVARAIGSEHKSIMVSNDELYAHVFDMLDYTDEPFADPAGLAFYILSRHAREHVTVALSGDGADELFGGYNKHRAELEMRVRSVATRAVSLLAPLWRALPKSRDHSLGDRIRKLDRFARASSLTAEDRYWQWCTFAGEAEVADLFGLSESAQEELAARKQTLVAPIADSEKRNRPGDNGAGMNDVMRADFAGMMPANMLRKVDANSMAHGLEVRVPFLDHELVEYVMNLPSEFKITRRVRKRILRDAFRDVVPPSIMRRRKHGFDVPMLPWFRSRMRPLIEDELLSDEFIKTQGIFDPASVAALRSRLFSERPGDVERLIWALVVFQYWYRRYLS